MQQFYRLYSIYSYCKMLTIFPVLYSMFLQLIYFIYSGLYLLILQSYLTSPHHSTIFCNKGFFYLVYCEDLCMSVYVSILFFFYSYIKITNVFKKALWKLFYDLFSRTCSKYTVMFFIYLVLLKFLRIHVISFFLRVSRENTFQS